MHYASNAPAPLTAEDIKRLRAADKLSLHHKSTNYNPEGMGTIVITKEIEVGGFKSEASVDLVVGSRFSAYRPDNCAEDYDLSMTADNIDGFVYMSAAQFDPEWQTVATLAKTGDRLYLLWLRGNSTPNLNGAGFVRDELSVVLERPRKNPEHAPLRLTFLLSVSVGSPNSARMIRTAVERKS